ncbi:MAG TPA: hypothetical protein VFY65_13025 [Longimicrobium sp.]|nr:hypothetical protein [Longimicrobium sp.]
MNAMRTMARRTRGMAALVVLAGCATLEIPNVPPRTVELRLDPAEWQQVLHAHDGGISVREYAAPGERAEAWTRLVSVQVYSDTHLAYPGVRPALSECRAVLQATCPGAEWTVLRESEQDAVYEWRTAGCPSEPDQHEVGRVMHGGGTWARISFSMKGRMDAATRDAWLRQLEEARLMAATP